MRYKTLLFLIIPIITQLSVIDTSFADNLRCMASPTKCKTSGFGQDCFISGTKEQMNKGSQNLAFFCSVAGNRSCLDNDKVIVLGDFLWAYNGSSTIRIFDDVKKYDVLVCDDSVTDRWYKNNDVVTLNVCDEKTDNILGQITNKDLSPDWQFSRYNGVTNKCIYGVGCYYNEIKCVYCKAPKYYSAETKGCVSDCTYRETNIWSDNAASRTSNLKHGKHAFILCTDVPEGTISTGGNQCVVYCANGETKYGVLECKRGFSLNEEATDIPAFQDKKVYKKCNTK